MNSNIAGRNATLKQVLNLTKEVPAAIAVVRECVVGWDLRLDGRTNIHAMESLAGAQCMNVGVCYVALIFLFNVVIFSRAMYFAYKIFLIDFWVVFLLGCNVDGKEGDGKLKGTCVKTDDVCHKEGICKGI